MKILILVSLVLMACVSHSQATYRGGTTSLALSDTTNEAGVKFKQRAYFRAMIYNFETSSLNIQVDILMYDSTGNTRLTRWITPRSKDFTITNAEYVRASNGNLVGSRDQMLSQYGVVQTPATDSTPIVYRQSVVPGYGDSLSVQCIGRYDYYLNLFDATGNRLHQDIIKSLMNKAYNEGKLN